MNEGDDEMKAEKGSRIKVVCKLNDFSEDYKDGDIFTLDSLTHYREELERVYHLLADEQSRKVFRMLLEYKISGKIHWLRQMETPREEIFQSFFPVSEGEAYVDLGAYDGDTIEEFISLCCWRYDRITALETDRRNFKKL